MQVQQQFLTYFVANNYISIDQSAYRQCHSTQTSLHHVIDDWLDNVSDDLYTGVGSLDIKKCFDTIDHEILLKKLYYYGIVDIELAWFRSYLTNRTQIVKCNGKVSEKSILNIGVPQGSVLGPLLFMIFVNDLSQNVHIGSANLYADDTLIYCAGNTIKEANFNLQICIDEVFKWYTGNKLVLNAGKSSSMLIASRYKTKNCVDKINIDLNGIKLDQLKTVDYLGMKIDECMSWNDHINKLCKAISFKVSKLARLRQILPYNTVLQIYNSVIQPTIDYAITIWGNSTPILLRSRDFRIMLLVLWFKTLTTSIIGVLILCMHWE